MHNFHLALVTGASSGIGEALCNLLAEKGIPLLITGRNTIRLNSLADRLRNKVDVTVCSLDLSEDREQLITMIKDLTPDLVINNAGFGLYGEVLDSSIEKQREMVQVNLEALFEINLESARAMRQRGLKGVIVNISSVAAFPVFPSFSVYSATKAFVLNFSQSFDEEMRPYGIRVLVSCPGRVSTHFQERASEGIVRSENTKGMMSAFYAAEQIWWQVEKRKAVHIFNWKYRFGVFLVNYLLPKRIVANFLRSYTHRE